MTSSSKGTLSGDLEESGGSGGGSGGGETLAAPDLEIEREVGRGGMGVVWEARQVSLGRAVAVKTLGAERCDDPAAVAKFEAEARVTGRLEHPNVPPVHVYGRDAGGRPFLCMKLVRGTEWAKLFAKLDLRAHLEILRRVCEAVAFAHSRGVLHRDLKPENVMVGEFGEVQVMDWGIAWELGKPAPESDGPRQPIGSPAYMPPEMAAREDEKLGPPTDVYLLGGILYEILTGAPPHAGASVFEALVAARRGEVEPPARRAPPGRKVPEALAAIAMRALDPVPAKRYAGAADLAAALEEYARHDASLELAEAAAALAAEGGGAATYGRLEAAIASFEQSLRLWEGNARAREGLTRARLALARRAVEAEDLALAEAQLEALSGGGGASANEVEDLRAKIAAVRAARARAEGRRRLALGAAGVLAVVALVAATQAVRAARAMLRRNAANAVAGEMYGVESAKTRVETFQRALGLDPQWEQGWFQLAIALSDRAADERSAGDLATGDASQRRAVEALDRAIELGVGPRGYYQRAQTYEDLHDPARALADYRKTAELDPQGFFGRAAGAAVALAEGRHRDVIELATLALGERHDADATFWRRGQAKLALGDATGAIADFDESIRVWSMEPDYWVARSDARRLAGDRAGASRDLVEALVRGPRAPLVIDRVSRWEKKVPGTFSADPVAAEIEAERALRADALDVPARRVRAACLKARGDAAGAQADLDIAQRIETIR